MCSDGHSTQQHQCYVNGRHTVSVSRELPFLDGGQSVQKMLLQGQLMTTCYGVAGLSPAPCHQICIPRGGSYGTVVVACRVIMSLAHREIAAPKKWSHKTTNARTHFIYSFLTKSLVDLTCVHFSRQYLLLILRKII